jgi:hypothetical protein
MVGDEERQRADELSLNIRIDTEYNNSVRPAALWIGVKGCRLYFIEETLFFGKTT